MVSKCTMQEDWRSKKHLVKSISKTDDNTTCWRAYNFRQTALVKVNRLAFYVLVRQPHKDTISQRYLCVDNFLNKLIFAYAVDTYDRCLQLWSPYLSNACQRKYMYPHKLLRTSFFVSLFSFLCLASLPYLKQMRDLSFGEIVLGVVGVHLLL